MTIPISTTYRLIGLAPSPAQLTFMKMLLGETLSAEERAIALQCTGRADLAPRRFQEGTLAAGRKSGKDVYIASPLLIHLAATDTGDPGTYLLCSPAKFDQSMATWRTVVSQLERAFPELIADIQESSGTVALKNGNTIKIASANFRNLRGPLYKCVILNEAAFFSSDSPDEGGANRLEYILDSVVGGMIATAHPLLLLLTSPRCESGVVWEHVRDRAANPDRLVWQAPTLLMNPSANQALMEKHRRDRGENFYRREYLAEFSEDSFAFIAPEDVDAAISHGNPFFSPEPGIRYCMGLDPGRKRDHFGTAIAFKDGERVICVWSAEWRPGLFGLKYADVLPAVWAKAREYGIERIASDQVDFGGIEASIPAPDGVPEFELEHIQTCGAAGAELADITRALFA